MHRLIVAMASTLVLTVLSTGCGPSAALEDLAEQFARENQKPGPSEWPAYSEAPLAGSVFGSDWKALTAVARPTAGNPGEISVEFYAETSRDACKSLAFPSTPYAMLTLPSNYTQTEYREGSTLTFVSLGAVSKNLIAFQTRMTILAVTATGFEAAVYASARDSDGTVSEINGRISVTDCSKGVAFKEWEDLVGRYTLKSFDGVAKPERYREIELDNGKSFYDRASGSYLKAVTFPLYLSVSDHSDMVADFGPIEGLGTTTVTDSGTHRTLQYSYDGPVRYEGQDITYKINLSVTKSSRQLEVQYTLEIPGHIKNTSHKFVLAK